VGERVSLFREPDAGNLPVRFDEREQEPGPGQTGLRRRGESPVNCHRETKAPAPVLDSTRHFTQVLSAGFERHRLIATSMTDRSSLACHFLVGPAGRKWPWLSINAQ
jgi:hypothetical protein